MVEKSALPTREGGIFAFPEDLALSKNSLQMQVMIFPLIHLLRHLISLRVPARCPAALQYCEIEDNGWVFDIYSSW